MHRKFGLTRKWYNIKQLIGLAKESKLRNSAPIKYQIGSMCNII